MVAKAIITNPVNACCPKALGKEHSRAGRTSIWRVERKATDRHGGSAKRRKEGGVKPVANI